MAFVLTGCRKEQINAYRIPKETDAAMAATPPAPDASQPQIKYHTPAGWTEQPASGMSLATFRIGTDKAEVTIMSFPREGITQLNLINIIREDSGLPPLSDEEVGKLVTPVSIGDEKGSLIDLTAATSATNSAPSNSIVIAILAHGGATWFFKLIGAPDVVLAQKPVLVDFLKTVSLSAGGAGVMPPGHPPMQAASANAGGREPAAAPPAFAQPPTGDKPAWDIPASWHEVPPTSMLLAKFVTNGNGGEADVTVSAFPGETGGLLANINRWRRSVALPEITAADVDKAYSSLDVLGGKAMLVDVSGTKSDKPIRLIGIIWPRGEQTWFYKLMGDSAVVGREKDAFLKFIQSVRYPNG